MLIRHQKKCGKSVKDESKKRKKGFSHLWIGVYEGVWYVYMYGWRWGLEVGVGVDTVKMRLWTNFFINPHMAHSEGDAPSKGDGRSK